MNYPRQSKQLQMRIIYSKNNPKINLTQSKYSYTEIRRYRKKSIHRTDYAQLTEAIGVYTHWKKVKKCM